MNESITTNALPPTEERKPQGNIIVTSNTIQPRRAEDIAKEARKPAAGLITTENIEQVQEENRKAAAKGKKGEK